MGRVSMILPVAILRSDPVGELEMRSSPIAETEWGKIAERLRRIPPYRNSKAVFVSLERALKQIRLNVLTDGKLLVLPSGSLNKGFLRIDPVAVPTARRSLAIQPHPRNPYASKIQYTVSLSPPIDLIVTTARLVGRDGTRLGDGQGHLDLQYAILNELSWLDARVKIVAIVDECQILPSLQVDIHDVDVHWIVTPREAFPTTHPRNSPGRIIWSRLSTRQIKRNDPLFHLNSRRHGNGAQK